MFKKISTLISAVTVIGLVGCSNQSSPISVVDNDVAQKTAYLSDMKMQDIAALGSNIWGLSFEKVGTSPNYRIYLYNNSTQTWTPTGHFGKRIAVSANGRCYHINAENQIWWGTGTSWGNIPNPPNQIELIDVSVGRVSFDDIVWVVSRAANGKYQIWKYRPKLNPAWVNLTPSNLIISAGAVAAYPYNGNSAAIIAGPNQKVYTTTDETRWTLHARSPELCCDVSIFSNKVVCSEFNDKYFKIWVGINGNYTLRDSYSQERSVSADIDRFYYMDIGNAPCYRMY